MSRYGLEITLGVLIALTLCSFPLIAMLPSNTTVHNTVSDNKTIHSNKTSIIDKFFSDVDAALDEMDKDVNQALDEMDAEFYESLDEIDREVKNKLGEVNNNYDIDEIGREDDNVDGDVYDMLDAENIVDDNDSTVLYSIPIVVYDGYYGQTASKPLSGYGVNPELRNKKYSDSNQVIYEPQKSQSTFLDDSRSNEDTSIDNNEVNYTSYQSIYDEYSKRMSDMTPNLIDEYKSKARQNTQGLNGLGDIYWDVQEKEADLYWEGQSEMAEYYWDNGSGVYSEYQDWVGKLYDVYQEETEKLFQAHMDYVG